MADSVVQQIVNTDEKEVDSERVKIEPKEVKKVVAATAKIKKRRLSSGIWVNFDFLDERDENGNLQLNKMRDLYEAYVVVSSTSSTNSASSSKSQALKKEDDDDLMEDFDTFSSKKVNVANKDFLELYYEDALLPRSTDLDVLMYWRNNAAHYPLLVLMAKDILDVPVSTVASESAFCCGSRVLDSYRSSLLPSTVQAIICLRDWSFGEVNMDPQLESLCGSVMNLKVDDGMGDTPLPSP